MNHYFEVKNMPSNHFSMQSVLAFMTFEEMLSRLKHTLHAKYYECDLKCDVVFLASVARNFYKTFLDFLRKDFD